MAFEIFKLTDIVTTEQESGQITSKTLVPHVAVLQGSAEIVNYPANRKLIKLENSGDYVTVTPSAEVFNRFNLNWYWDNVGGVNLLWCVRGEYDHQAALTPYERDGNWYVKVEHPAPGAGHIREVGGVFYSGLMLQNPEDSWPTPFQTPTAGSDFNFVQSFINYPDASPPYTEILLYYEPGYTVQVYYAYWDDRLTTARYEDIGQWPTYAKLIDPDSGWWMAGTAQDKLFDIANALLFDSIYRGVDNSSITGRIWDFWKARHTDRKGRIEIDFNGRSGWRDAWRNFLYTYPASESVVDRTFGGLAVVQDPLNAGAQVFKFSMYLPSGASGFLLYVFGCEDITQPPYDTMTGISLDFLGKSQGDRLIVMLGSREFYDTNRDNSWDMYWTAIPDYYTAWESLDIPWRQFWKIDSLMYDGDRLPLDWYIFGSHYASIDSKAESQFTLDGDIFYTHAEWHFSPCNYAGCGFLNDWGAPIADKSDINFAMQFDVAVSRIYMEIYQERTWNELRNAYDYSDLHSVWLHAGTDYSGSTDWQRVTVSFADFSPPVDTAKEAYVVNFQVVDQPAYNTIRFTDIKCGGRESYDTVLGPMYGVYFSAINYGKPRPQEFYLNNIIIGPDVDNPFPWVPTLGMNMIPDGPQFWRGPGFVHYMLPNVPYQLADTTVENAWLDFYQAAQDEFINRYGGVKGPFLMGHGLYSPENFLNARQEEIGDFTWWRTHRGKWEQGTWLFNGNLADSWKRGNDLTWQGGGSPSYEAGICQPTDTAVILDGSHYLTQSSADFNVGTHDFCLEMIVKRASSGLEVLASKLDGAAGIGWELYFDASDELTLYLGDVDGGQTYQSPQNLILTDTANFHYVAVSVDRDGGVLLKLDYTGSESVSAANPKSLDVTDNLIFGRHAYGASGYFTGSIDLVRFQVGYAPGWYELQQIFSIMEGYGTTAGYSELGAGTSQGWSFKKLAQYYYFSGNLTAKAILDEHINWLLTAGMKDVGDYKAICYWFHDWGYNFRKDANPSVPDHLASYCEGLLWYYFTNGDPTLEATIYDLLGTIYAYQQSDGSWESYGRRLAFAMGYIGQLLGLVVNGPPGAGHAYPHDAYDESVFESLHDFFFSNINDTHPHDEILTDAILNADLIPYEQYEKRSRDAWDYYYAYAGTTESIGNTMMFALEWGRYSEDYSWFVRLKNFLFQCGGLNVDAEFTLEAQIYPSTAPWEGDIIHKANAYRLYWDNGQVKGGFYSGSTWYGVETGTIPAAFFYHAALTYDGTMLKLWLNGREQDSLAVAEIPDQNTNQVYIGGGNQFYGYIADVRITGKALEQAAVTKAHMDWFAKEALNYIELLEIYIDGERPVFYTSNHESLSICSHDYHLVQSASFRTYEPGGFQGHGLSRDLQTYAITTDVSVWFTDYWAGLIANTDIRRAEVQLKATWAGADPTNPDEVVHVYRGHVLDWDVKDNVLVLKCAENAGFSHRLPIRRYSYFCGHPFKKYKCTYAGSEDYCHKSKLYCEQLGNGSNFGGFENQPRLMRTLV